MQLALLLGFTSLLLVGLLFSAERGGFSHH
jgi:hypothetical protein